MRTVWNTVCSSRDATALPPDVFPNSSSPSPPLSPLPSPPSPPPRPLHAPHPLPHSLPPLDSLNLPLTIMAAEKKFVTETIVYVSLPPSSFLCVYPPPPPPREPPAPVEGCLLTPSPSNLKRALTINSDGRIPTPCFPAPLLLRRDCCCAPHSLTLPKQPPNQTTQ